MRGFGSGGGLRSGARAGGALDAFDVVAALGALDAVMDCDTLRGAATAGMGAKDMDATGACR